MGFFEYIRQIKNKFVARVIFIMVVVMVSLAGIFDFFLITMQKKTFEQEVVRNGLADVLLLAQTTKFGVFAENELDLLPLVDGFLEREDVAEIIVLNKQGAEIVRKKGHHGQSGTSDYYTEEIAALVSDSRTSSHIFLPAEDVYIFFCPVNFASAVVSEVGLYLGQYHLDAENEVIGHAVLIRANDAYEKRVAQILQRTGWFVSLFFIAGIIIAVFVVRRITRPIHTLLSRVRQGVGIEQQEDINLLTETYGNLIDNLSASFETIKDLKDGLEETVKGRTAELRKANDKLVDRQKKLEQTNVRLALTIETLNDTRDQLVQSEKLASIGQLVAGVAHEINNTINFVSGALPSLKRSLADLQSVVGSYDNLQGKKSAEEIDREFEIISAKQEDVEFADIFHTIDLLLTNIEEGTRRTAAIINDLRIFSRVKSEKLQLVDINNLIEANLSYVHKDLLQGVTIRKEFEDIGLVPCLPGRINQVFLNILNNGMQSMNGQGVMVIHSWKDDSAVHVTFQDSGCGISPDIIHRIFDPFFTSKEVGQGCGLGLGISYEIVQQHGGEIKVSSEQGKGSVFEVVLPLVQDEFAELVHKEKIWKN